MRRDFTPNICRNGVIGVAGWLCLLLATLLAAEPSHYEHRANHDPDGIGKFYRGREIARVMGHEGADWLERPERLDEERPDQLHALLDVRAGQVAADIGAGTGYHSLRLARSTGPRGQVYAVDIQAEMLELLRNRAKKAGLTNIVAVLGTETDPKLKPASLDLALLVDVYHEFSHPHEMLSAIVHALKPGGRLAFVEFKAEDASVPIKPLHKMSEAQIRLEAEGHGLAWTQTHRGLPWQHLVIFTKKP